MKKDMNGAGGQGLDPVYRISNGLPALDYSGPVDPGSARWQETISGVAAARARPWRGPTRGSAWAMAALARHEIRHFRNQSDYHRCFERGEGPSPEV